MKSFRQWTEDLDNLHQATQSAFPNTEKRHNAVDTVGEQKINLTPKINKKTLLVKAETKGSNDSIYDTSILFHNVNYKPIPPNGQTDFGDFVIKSPATGQSYILDKLGMKGNEVKVNCTCPDFKYMFSKANAEHGALHGQPEVEISSRNSSGSPGLCKHLIKLSLALDDRGILTSTPRSGF
jgi:hypothetical protein